jgi:hypothetical protein
MRKDEGECNQDKKKPTKQTIGLNFYINQDIWINNNTSLFFRI